MDFFEVFRDVPGKSYPSIELGENIRFHEGRVLHLSAFGHNGDKMIGKRSLSRDFLKEEKGDIISRKAAKVAKIILERRG